jgi:hypothetical protein
MTTAWHTPDTKIEEAIADYIGQEGEDDLRGWNIITRLNVAKKVFPQVCVVCRRLEDAHPQTIEITGNWDCDVEIRVESIVKRTTGAQHDAAAGLVSDLFMRTNLITQLNDIATDSEVAFLRGRFMGRDNDWDDAKDRQETVLRWHTVIVPHRTTG